MVKDARGHARKSSRPLSKADERRQAFIEHIPLFSTAGELASQSKSTQAKRDGRHSLQAARPPARPTGGSAPFPSRTSLREIAILQNAHRRSTSSWSLSQRSDSTSSFPNFRLSMDSSFSDVSTEFDMNSSPWLPELPREVDSPSLDCAQEWPLSDKPEDPAEGAPDALDQDDNSDEEDPLAAADPSLPRCMPVFPSLLNIGNLARGLNKSTNLDMPQMISRTSNWLADSGSGALSQQDCDDRAQILNGTTIRDRRHMDPNDMRKVIKDAFTQVRTPQHSHESSPKLSDDYFKVAEKCDQVTPTTDDADYDADSRAESEV